MRRALFLLLAGCASLTPRERAAESLCANICNRTEGPMASSLSSATSCSCMIGARVRNYDTTGCELVIGPEEEE